MDTSVMNAPAAPSALPQLPELMLENSIAEMFAVPLEEQRRFHLASAKTRFEEMVGRIPVLAKLAQEQGVTRIDRLEDLAPLLMPHTAYKSYPMSLLEKDRFDLITRWMNGFTTHDLSGLDASGCKSIDEWLEFMDANSDVRVIHSTGTSGKLSFLPRGTLECGRMVTGWRRLFDRYRDEPARMGAPPDVAPTIFCQYRHGGMAQHRLLDAMQDLLYGGDGSKIITTNPGRFSADAASVSGRMRVAESRGELGALHLSPTLMARREAFLADQLKSGDYLDRFFERCAEFRGKPVAIIGHVPLLHGIAVQGLRRGYTDMFDSQSFVMAGGGLKGQSLPDDWRETIDRFFGGARLSDGYGMSEVVASLSRICPCSHYHVPPWAIPFLLDPKTGAQFPRSGTHTGRFGCFDVNAETYWGGFVTGDEVTLCWGDDAPCGCGRIGPYLHAGLRRYSEQEGGDDKVTCAGAPAAHDNAIDFLIRSMGG